MEYQRPDAGYRFAWGGVNTKDVPDSLPADKYQAAQNVRATADNALRTRPGYEYLFQAGNNAVTDIRGYTGFNNNALPRFLARDAGGSIYLDTGGNVGSLSGNTGYGVSMVPFRPRESALTWMYIASQADYQRFSAPKEGSDFVTQAKVGIAEPQLQVQAGPSPLNFEWIGPNDPGVWMAAGNNTSASADITRSSDTATVVLADPIATTRKSMAVGANTSYGIGETIDAGNNFNLVIIEDVIPALADATPITIQSVRYNSGNTGNCTLFLGVLPQQSQSRDIVQGIRRGSLMYLNNGGSTEWVLAYDTIPGANGTIAVETSTAGTWAANANVSLVSTIVVNSNASIANNTAIVATGMACNLNNGVSTISHTLTNPQAFAYVNGQVPTLEDYIHISLMMSDPSVLTQMLLLFYLDGNFNNGNILYYAVRPSDLAQIRAANANYLATQLGAAEADVIASLPTSENLSAASQATAGANQWAEILFPVSALGRIGSDASKTLASCRGFQIQADVTGPTTLSWSSLWNAAGFPPDVGNNGAEYRYLCVPSNSNPGSGAFSAVVSGVQGNPTPLMKYGVSPRRQAVTLKTSSLNSSYDPQIDTWHVYRTGGPITSYRYIGSTAAGNDFVDTFSNDAAAAGNEVVLDNTEPWPSIDQPWSVIAGNGANSIVAYGQFLEVGGIFNIPNSMNRWLPGTLFQVGAQDAFTLRSRPAVSGNNATFEFEECVGSGNKSRVSVLEPNVARQTLPYVWGPDEQGFFFGSGDTYRPGVVSWAKSYAPDAVPTKSNVELCPPSEPQLGGDIINGISLAASSLRWWQMQFQQGNQEQLYVPVEAPVGKRLAAPYGKCSDGKAVYFWSDDCIAMTGGTQAVSLTDEDLYNLFPHGDTKGVNVARAGVTMYAPDYTRVAQFRLAIRTGFLFAFYLDTDGVRRTIVCDLARKAWQPDSYADSMSVGYSVEQPTASLQSLGSLYPRFLFGDANGTVWKSADLTNDGKNRGNNFANAGTPISAIVATREDNVGDARSDSYFGDLFVDVLAPAGMVATPVCNSTGFANNTTIAANNNRQHTPVSVGGASLQSYLGIKLTWTDNFATQTVPTQLYVWQPSYVDKPETTLDRFGDWVDFGEASYVRGATIYADTLGSNKSVKIRNADNNVLFPLQSVLNANNTASIINHNGEQEISYWFNPPFVAHMVREEPQDLVPWRKFGIKWLKDPWPELTDLASPWINIRDTGQAGFLQGLVLPLEVGDSNNNTYPALKIRVDGSNNLVDLTPQNFVKPAFNVKTGVAYALSTPVVCHQAQIIPQSPCRVWWSEIIWKSQDTPDLGINWETQWLGFQIKGYKHIPRIEFAYASANNVTLTILSKDGTSPTAITLPASGNNQTRVLLTTTFNKGQLYKFAANSTTPFQIWRDDCLVWVCEWGRLGPGVPYKLGADFGDGAAI